MNLAFSNTAKKRRMFGGWFLVAMAAVLLLSFGISYLVVARNSSVAATGNCPVEVCISLDGLSGEPQAVTVKTGSYVQFNALDGRKHNIFLAHSAVQHDDHSRFESGDFAKDEAWKIQIKKDGSYTFVDKYDQSLKVSVVAYTPGRSYKID